MKNSILLSLLMFVFGSALMAQTNYDTISATYIAGDISTDDEFDVLGETSTCPGSLNVVVPQGSTIVSVDVEYSMTAVTSSSMNSARSQLQCSSPNGTFELAVISGTGGWSQGTEAYSRTGLNIANNVTPPPFGQPITFKLHAGDSHWSAPVGCSDTQLKVDAGTWKVTVIYLPPGSPGNVSNAMPADMAQLVDLNTDLTWDFGNNTTTYDLYFGTDNPPMTIVVADGTPGGASGSYDPGVMLDATEYFWRVVGKNATNDNPGTVWSFKTKCATPTYPYLENFDASAELPDCWIPLSTSTNEFSTAKINTWGSLSAPNSIVFNADGEPTPNIVLVLPEVGTISDKMLSLYGKNDVDWFSGNPYPNPVEVGTITDPSDINTFTSYTSFIPGGDWELIEVFFADYVGSDTYIAIKGVVPQYNVVYIDDVTVDLIPTCIKPLDLVAVDVQAEQATIGWTDMNGATSWNIEYGISPYTPTGTPTITGVTNPATITGLLDGEYYDIYAQANCGGGDLSAWSWPLTILTDCLPWAVPFSEDFGVYPPWPDVYSPPLCWSIIDIHSGEFGGAGYGDYNSREGMCVWMGPENDNTAELILAAPALSPDISTLRTSFWAKMGGNSGDSVLIMGTITDPSDETTFTPYDTISGMTGEYQLFTVYYNNYVGTDMFIAWRFNSEEQAIRQLYIDDITIEAIPSCVEPYRAYVDGATSNSAMVNWLDPVETGTDWQIEVGAMGFTPGTGSASNPYTYNATAAAMQSFEMTGLSAATTYDAYIRTDCGAGDYSVWAGPITFLSGFDAFTSLPVTEDFESGMGITGNAPANVQNWEINTDLQHSGLSSVHNPYGNDGDNVLFVLGTFDFTAKSDIMLSFWQIAKTDGRSDHCYVEISTDGGTTFDQLPESTYAGTGRYREDDLYTPFDGPAFDEDSYVDWGTSNTTPENTWWKHEFFNLTDYSAYDNVVIRFRLWSNGYTNRAGWYIDDIAIEALGTPGFNVDPLTITEDATPVMPAMVDMTMGNTGDFPASYTAEVVYNEVDLFAENFDTGIPVEWTVVNNGNTPLVAWTGVSLFSGYSFDGTPFAVADAYQGYGPVTNLSDEELISPVIDASAYVGAALRLEFDHAFDADYNPGDTAFVYVYDGTQWVEIYKSGVDDGKINYNSNGVHKAYDVSMYANANFQVKFHHIETSLTSRGQYFAIDNFRLRASNSALGWLTINGAEVTGGVSMPDADMIPAMVNVYMDATELAPGTYTADILVTSNDAGNPTTTIPVTMNVIAGSTIGGTLTYANVGMTALETCTVELYNDNLDMLFSTTTDVAGYYEFPGILDGTYTLVTTSSLPYTYVTDVGDVNQNIFHILGTPVTGVYFLAGDVTGNSVIDVSDVNDMIFNILGSLSGYTISDWVFEEQTVIVSGANATQDIQGLQAGDSDGSY